MVWCQLPEAPTLGWRDESLMASDVSLHVALLIFAFFPTSLSFSLAVLMCAINCRVALLSWAEFCVDWEQFGSSFLCMQALPVMVLNVHTPAS